MLGQLLPPDARRNGGKCAGRLRRKGLSVRVRNLVKVISESRRTEGVVEDALRSEDERAIEDAWVLQGHERPASAVR